MESPGYESLARVLEDAFNQAAIGKGRARHAREQPFHEQRMQTISELLDSNAGMAFQAIKKLTEGLDMADPAARRRELLGAIVYIAGIIVREDQRDQGLRITTSELSATKVTGGVITSQNTG